MNMETLIRYSNGKRIEVPPDEAEPLNNLRVVVDEVFLSMNEYIQTFGTYKKMDTCEDGVRKHLRSLLFKPTKQGRIWPKGVGTGAGASNDGLDRSGISASMKEGRMIRARMEVCENKLFSLLFSVIYDSTATKCRLIENNPSAKKIIAQKEGSSRTVSCLKGTRVFLRDLMCSVLSHHGKAVKVLYDVLPPVFTVLPQMFMLIARTFFGILSTQCPKESENAQKDKPERAFEMLRASLIEIKSYITIWGRRNFMAFFELQYFKQASFDEGSYKLIRDLLQAMVVVLPPAGDEGLNPTFRKRACFDFAPDQGHNNRTELEKCVAVGERSPNSGAIEVVQSDSKACHGFVKALTACAIEATRMKSPQLGDVLGTEQCPPEVWLSCRNIGYIKRLNDLAESEERFRTEGTKETSKELTELFVRHIREDIAQCWTALGMSNIHAVKYLNSMEISGPGEVAEAAVELIFGGGIAAMTLYERKRDVTKICAELQSDKAPFVVMVDKQKDDMEDEPSNAHNTGTDGSDNHMWIDMVRADRQRGMAGPSSSGERGASRRVNSMPGGADIVEGEPSSARNTRTEGAGNHTWIERVRTDRQRRIAGPSSSGERGASRRVNSMPGGADHDRTAEHTGTEEGVLSDRRVGGKRRFKETKRPPGDKVYRLD